MSDFLIVDPIFVKISEITEIKSHPKDASRLIIETHETRTLVKPEIKFESRYLESTLYQAKIARDSFITFTEAYELGQDAIDPDHSEASKEECKDCKDDPDLCNRDH